MNLKTTLDRSTPIDALRGLAAIMVLIYHARSSFWIGARESYSENGLKADFNVWMGYLSVPIGYGWLGVTLFFVLSGYCIHRRGARLIASGNAAQMNWYSFAKRRLWRIYPTYIGALVLTAVIDYYLEHRFGQLNPAQDNSLFAFISSVLTLQGYASPFFGSNGVFWTLAMEMHLYAAYPILFAFSNRYGPNRVLLIVFLVSLTYAILEYSLGFESLLIYRTQRGPIFVPYWFTWTIGFYLAEIEAKRGTVLPTKTWLLLLGLALPVALGLSLNEMILFAELFWAIVFAVVVRFSLVSRDDSLLNRMSGFTLAWVGAFSYSLYAIHAPLLQLYHSLISPADMNFKFKTLWPAIGGVVVVLPCAYCFYLLLESWSIRRAAFRENRSGSVNQKLSGSNR